LNRARLVQRAHTPRGLDEFFEDGRSLPLTSAQTGRAWLVSELRQKSFDDLHRLWIILLKERNLLASQRLEAKRYGVPITHYSNRSRVIKCKKTMRRIMTVLTERRIAYEEAFLKTKI
ncbi:MRP-L47-domain-containing protein, partial [Ramicandelaber brevisporus]